MAKHSKGPWTVDLHHTRRNAGRTHAMVSSPDSIVPLAAVVLGVDGSIEEEGRANARLIGGTLDLLDVAARWAMAMFQSGIAPVENSDDPLECLTFDTQAALFKATGRDVVADNLEALTAGNRASLTKAEGVEEGLPSAQREHP